MRADTVGPGHRADYGRRTRPVQRGSGSVEPIMADAAGLSTAFARRSRGVRAGLGRITPCLRRVRLVRASPPRRPGGPRLRLRQVSQKSPVHPLLGLTPPAPKRSVPLEFCQFGNSVPRQDRSGAPFALLARCRPQSPLMAPHLNSRSGCPGHSTLRVEGLEVHVKVDSDAAPDVLSEWLAKVEARCPIADNVRSATPREVSPAR